MKKLIIEDAESIILGLQDEIRRSAEATIAISLPSTTLPWQLSTSFMDGGTEAKHFVSYAQLLKMLCIIDAQT